MQTLCPTHTHDVSCDGRGGEGVKKSGMVILAQCTSFLEIKPLTVISRCSESANKSEKSVLHMMLFIISSTEESESQRIAYMISHTQVDSNSWVIT